MWMWRLEILRIWRTRRIIALAAVFLIIGIGDPLLVHFLSKLIANSSKNGVIVVAPTPTPASSIAAFGSSVAQLGTLVTVVVGAATLAIDSRPALAAFYRTRIRHPRDLILPRFVAVVVFTCLALVIGIIAAWYETSILIGPVSAADLAVGFGFEALWVLFSIALVAAWSSMLKSVLAVAAWSVATLLALSLIGTIHVLSAWSPTALSSSIGPIVGGTSPNNFTGVSIVSTIGAIALLGFAIVRIGRREQ